MRQRRAFKPTPLDRLEDRVVLSEGGIRGPSVVVSGLYPYTHVLNRRQQPIVAEVNQAFDSFQNDYNQARATYFASLLNQTDTAAATDAKNAFTLYTTQRVSLLAQQIISSFLQSSRGTARAKGQPDLLKQLVTLKLAPTQGQAPAGGSLLRALLDNIPPTGTSAPTAALYSLGQDNAIEAARVAIINGVNIAKNADYGNRPRGSHHN